MNINTQILGGGRPVAPTAASSKGGVAASSTVTGNTATRDSEGVTVKLTDAASRLAAGVTQVKSQQDASVDPARLAQLKEAIASGRYHVDAKRVAAKFMGLEAQLG